MDGTRNNQDKNCKRRSIQFPKWCLCFWNSIIRASSWHIAIFWRWRLILCKGPVKPIVCEVVWSQLRVEDVARNVASRPAVALGHHVRAVDGQFGVSLSHFFSLRILFNVYKSLDCCVCVSTEHASMKINSQITEIICWRKSRTCSARSWSRSRGSCHACPRPSSTARPTSEAAKTPPEAESELASRFLSWKIFRVIRRENKVAMKSMWL